MTKKYKSSLRKFVGHLFAVLVLAGLFSLSPLLGGQAAAGGKPDGQGNVIASLCYNPAWKPGNPGSPFQRLDIESTRQACRNQGLTVIEPGQAMPVGACLIGENIQYYGDTGNGTQSQGCEAQGGRVIQAGEQLPAFAVKDPTGSADGTTGNSSGQSITIDSSVTTSGKVCGGPPSEGNEDTRIDPVIDLGCKGKGNSILDLTFAVIRFLTLGAGLVMVGSTIVAGIQYTVSRGDPQATSAALKRIAATVSAMFFFIFAYAMLNWVVPAGVLK